MSDEKFEEFLQREAKAYNTPPASVPRDEMWDAVARTRAIRRTAPRPVAAHRGLRYGSWIGMAATLLLGVGIGRFMMDGDGPSTAETPAQVAVTTQTPPVDTPPAPTSLTPAPRTSEVVRGSSPPRFAVRRAVSTGEAPVDGSSTPYQVASQHHLARAEALIAVVATSPRETMIDSLTLRWARDMLTNTRLLLDSPAGEDPMRRRLLEDLETLLVQLVQRSGAAVDERALFDRTLQRTQLLTRLRTGTTGT